MESIRTLAGHLEALSGVQNVDRCIAPEVRRQSAEGELNFQIPR